MSLPPNWGDDALSKHMNAAINKGFMTFTSDKPGYEYLVLIDSKFSAISHYYPNFQWPLLFLAQARSGYRAACQLAISGQIIGSYPILRMCLECSLYALHINQDESALDIWLKRHESDASKKAMKKKFLMEKLQSTLKHIDSELSKNIQTLYELCIDLGGHPNPTGMFRGVQLHEDMRKISISGLQNDSDISQGIMSATGIGFSCLRVFAKIFPESLGSDEDTFFEELQQHFQV